jgi:hypothetical protein
VQCAEEREKRAVALISLASGVGHNFVPLLFSADGFMYEGDADLQGYCCFFFLYSALHA